MKFKKFTGCRRKHHDKHLEVISRQMMRWVRIEDIGDTEFLPRSRGQFRFREETIGSSRRRPSGNG